MTKPSRKDLLIAAKWLRNDIDCADVGDAPHASDVKRLQRVAAWLEHLGQIEERSDTASPLAQTEA